MARLVLMIINFISCNLFQDDDGNTALSVACQKGHAETARVLLEKEANIDYQDKVRTFSECVH